MPSTWTALRGALDDFLPGPVYTAYRISNAEHVATTDMTVAGLRETLRMGGYVPQRLSAAKKHPETGQLHDLSMRRVPDRHPAKVIGTELEAWHPTDCQYHIHVFDLGDTRWVASHYELRPDLWPPNVARLREHYRPEYGQTYLRGVTDVDGGEFYVGR